MPPKPNVPPPAINKAAGSNNKTVTAKKPAAPALAQKAPVKGKSTIQTKSTPTKKDSKVPNNNAAKTSTSATKSENKSPTAVVWKKEDLAAIKIQSLARRYLARLLLEKKKKEKEEYDKEMDRLEKEAYVYLVKLQRAEAERKQQLEDEERRRIMEHNKRKKRMLEAAFDGEKSQVQKILNEVSELDNKNGLGNDVIGRAIRNRHQLELINCRDPNNNTPLLEAAGGGSVDVVRFLLDRGADVNARGQFLRTALYRAAYSGHIEVVQILLENGADPRLYDESAQTPVDIACNDATKEILSNWNIENTEKMLTRIEIFRKKRVEEESQRFQAELEQMDEKLKMEEKEYAAVKLKLSKCYEEREKRITEHDLAVASGYDKTDVTEQLIHDAEFELESVKLQLSKITEKISLTRLAMREKKLEEKQLDGGNKNKKGNENEEDEDDEEGIGSIHCHVKELDDVLFKDVGNRIRDSGRWPFVIDRGGLASTFLRYRDTNFINALSPANRDSNLVRLALLGAIRYGKPFVLDMMEIDLFEASTQRMNDILPNLMQMILDKTILNPQNYLRLVRPNDGKEYDKNNFMDHQVKHFQFILLTSNAFPAKNLLKIFLPIWVDVNK